MSEFAQLFLKRQQDEVDKYLIPNDCYPQCLNLQREGDKGMTREKCVTNSPFYKALVACGTCYLTQSTDDGEGTAIPGLVDYIEYCYKLAYTSTMVVYNIPGTPSAMATYPLPVVSAGASTSPAAASEPSSESAGESSKAWIAGPVIGGVVAIGLLVGAFLYFRRRRRRPDTSTSHEESPPIEKLSPMPPAEKDSPMPTAHHEMNAHEIHEMEGHRPLGEVPAAELPGGNAPPYGFVDTGRYPHLMEQPVSGVTATESPVEGVVSPKSTY